jgi:hypothetical protein
MRTTTMQEIREIAAVQGIVVGAVVGLFGFVAVVQAFASLTV